MRVLGWILVLLGCLVALIAFAMDTTVALSDGTGRVHNIGLMKRQDSTLTTGGLLIVVGVLVLLFGRRSTGGQAVQTRACPYCAEQIQPTAVVCRFCNRQVTPTVEPSQEQRMHILGIKYRDGMYWVDGESHYMLSRAIKVAEERAAAKRSES